MIIGGMFILTGGTRAFRGVGLGKAIIFGLLTGAIIAGYTLWDKYTATARRRFLGLWLRNDMGLITTTPGPA